MRYFLFFISILFSHVYCSQFSIEAYVNQTNISTDDYIKFTIKSNERIGLSKLSFKDFIIRQGPFTSSSSQTTIINGKFEHVKEYSSTFILSPKQHGELVIESIQATYDDETYKTKPITITVSKGKTNKVVPSTSPSTSNQNNSKFFARLITPKKQLYLGENILLEYKIYASTYHIRNLEITDYELPMSNDIWTELLEPKNNQWKEQIEVINGVQYRVFTLKKEIISPQKTGEITITPFEVKTLVNRDFFNRGQQKKLKSNALNLKVKPLPPNPPPSFNGQVGRNYKLKVDIKNTELNVDDPLDINIEISGNGNLKQLELPNLNLPQDLEKYPEEIKSNIKVNINGISGKKKLHQLVIPRFHGSYDIPSVSFTYFDLNKKKYKTLYHPNTTIQVAKSEKTATNTTLNFERPQQDEVITINENIRHIKTDTKLFDFSNPIFGTGYYWILLSVSPLLLVLSLFFLSNRGKFTNTEKAFLKDLNKETQTHLVKAENNLSNKDYDSFYKEIYMLWTSFISKKYIIDIAEMNRSTIHETLMNSQIKEEFIDELDKILTYCEMAQYSPLSGEEAENSLINTKKLLLNLRKHA
ncbi:MAG: BatD family protein [Bacteroidota bacterium]|nr:BatD family protein [Bacteroidota bacterium]